MGFMGSGKSTVGQAMADKLGWRYIDTDVMVVERLQMDIPSVFKTYGESRFRETELEVLEDVIHSDKSIISTGGGLPCSDKAIEIINQHSNSYYLYISAQQLSMRLWKEELRSTRPLLQSIDSQDDLKEFIITRLVKRERFYYDSRGIIDATQSVESVVEDIIQLADLA